MTWAEFQIRLYGWKRKDELESYKLRKIGFAAMWSFHADFKKLPRTEQKYWSIGNTVKPTLNEDQRNAMRAAVEIYHQEIKAKNGE